MNSGVQKYEKRAKKNIKCPINNGFYAFFAASAIDLAAIQPEVQAF